MGKLLELDRKSNECFRFKKRKIMTHKDFLRLLVSAGYFISAVLTACTVDNSDQ